MSDEIQIGDVVELKSGGPEMTVTEIGPSASEEPSRGLPLAVGQQDPVGKVKCEWWDAVAKERWYPPAALKRVSGQG